MKKIIISTALVAALLAPAMLFSQDTEPSAEIQQAKEDVVVVYDLGRFFGYVLTMVEESSKLALSQEQLEVFHEVMVEIKQSERIEPDWADEQLERLELDILTPDQLLAVDQLALAREESRDTEESGSGQGKGQSGESGTNPLQSFISGGAFNPILDETKSMGEGFAGMLSYVTKKLGK